MAKSPTHSSEAAPLAPDRTYELPGGGHSSEAAPLAPDRTYELPGGGHLGHAAALNVPCSEGHASFSSLDRDTDETALMQAEPTIEPHRQMEAGTEYDDESWHRLAPLFSPIQPASSGR